MKPETITLALRRRRHEEIEVGDAESRIEILEFMSPAQREAGEIVGEGPDAVPELIRRLREEAKVL